MKAFYLNITFLITFLLMGCGKAKNLQDKEKYVTIRGSFTVEEDDVEPPPRGFKSGFRTFEEWLTYICKNERPNKTIDTYNFGLFEGQNEYTIYLNGTNTYKVSEDHSKIQIEFSPIEMYFSLPKSEYQGLKRDQIYAKISNKLKGFMKTEDYKNSFFLEANHVKTEWNGETWSPYHKPS